MAGKKTPSAVGFTKSELQTQRNDIDGQIKTLNTFLSETAQDTSVSHDEVRLIRDQILYLEMVTSILDKRLKLLPEKTPRK